MIIKFDTYIKENVNKNKLFINDISIRVNSLLLTYTNKFIFLKSDTQHFNLKQKYCVSDSFSILYIDIYHKTTNDLEILLSDDIPEGYDISLKKTYSVTKYNYNIENIIKDIKKDIDNYINHYYDNILTTLLHDGIEYILPYVSIFDEEKYLDFIERIIVNYDKLNFQSSRNDIIKYIIQDIYEEKVYSHIKDKLYNRIKHYIDAKNFDLI